MSYVRIVSKRKGGVRAQEGELVIDVDRSNPILGNREVLSDHTNAAERDRVIDVYEAKLAEDVARGGPMSQEIGRLARLVDSGQRLALQCWCAPRRCHVNPIRSQIARILGRDVTPPDEKVLDAPPAPEQASLF